MRRAITLASQFILLLAWALWFGGMMALFLFVQKLFHENRTVAIDAAPRMFLAFELYQLILAAIALVAAFVWRLGVPSKLITSVFTLLGIATFIAVVGTMMVTPKMEQLRRAGQSSDPRFMKLHGISMALYSGEAAFLLAGGVVAFIALGKDRAIAVA
jgi:hypothetical protein